MRDRRSIRAQKSRPFVSAWTRRNAGQTHSEQLDQRAPARTHAWAKTASPFQEGERNHPFSGPPLKNDRFRVTACLKKRPPHSSSSCRSSMVTRQFQCRVALIAQEPREAVLGTT